jgi:hypothetical protein
MESSTADMASTIRERSEDKSNPQPNHSVNDANVKWETTN